ncbi:MAG: M28 family peptidase [Clostridia bacterium]|nr:M28 family peptidase [Clostridia bacterium]
MEKELLLQKIEKDLNELCVQVNHRHVGSPGNQRSTKYVAERFSSAGLSVQMPEFDCIDWNEGKVRLRVGSTEVQAFISPYSLSCNISCNFEAAGNLNELMSKDFTGKIAVLHGELAKEQLMPKNFIFYNPEEHQQIIKLLEEKNPMAIVTITTKDFLAAGALYPFPLIEDGDFDIPSIYTTEEEGKKIINHPDSIMHLSIESFRIPSKGSNVIGFKEGQVPKKITLCAHVDTKKDTPGALDDGTGIAVLLAVAELLKEYTGKYGVEILAFNGEDYYAASGQMQYYNQTSGQFDQIVLNVNIDGAGYKHAKTSYCTLECEGKAAEIIESVFSGNEEFVRIEPWIQGDHMIFAMNQVPAIAIASENPYAISAEITHTPKDTLENVDMGKVFEIAVAIKNLIEVWNKNL